MRRIEDPLSGSATTFDEYCAGNQVVTVAGPRVVIADYGKQQLLEIDREAGTYSITGFDEIARANELLAPRRQRTASLTKPDRADDVKVDVRVDERVRLSRGALDVLIGAAYPNVRAAEHDAVAAATRVRDLRVQANAAGQPAVEMHALPVEQTFTIDVAGERTTFRKSVVSVDSERAPQQLLVIPPGAARVESRLTRLARELRELEDLP